jgi:protein O-GlcNAc transferase
MMRELIKEGLRQRLEHGAPAALPFFEKAAEIDPTSHLPFFMLGNATSELGDLDTAVRYFVRARDLCPNEYVIRFNLGLHQLLRGYIEAAIEELRVACGLNPEYLPAQSTYIMALHSSDRIGPEEIAATIRRWGGRFALQHREIAPTPRRNPQDSEKLRVGFVSGDFRMHSVAHFFEPLLDARNRDGFAYVLYGNSDEQDSVTERLRSCSDGWRSVLALSDDALIKVIREDRVDILVDLSGHTAFNRLSVFARRAAPVQVSYLGCPDSTGLPTMDFRITDAATDPAPIADTWHSERLLRLPGSQWCFRPYGTSAEPGPLPARANGFVTFGSFNQLSKISDTMLQCWAEILVNTPNSRLRLTRIRSPQRAADMVAILGDLGVSPDRIDCVSNRDDPPHGSQFSGVDIALDHYPYNGVTTTCESLYFGVPVISLHGRNCVSRSGLSLLSSLGLSDLVAATPQQYVEKALALARDQARLEYLRNSLRPRFDQSPLRDERRFAAQFEDLLRCAWTAPTPSPSGASPKFAPGGGVADEGLPIC